MPPSSQSYSVPSWRSHPVRWRLPDDCLLVVDPSRAQEHSNPRHSDEDSNFFFPVYLYKCIPSAKEVGLTQPGDRGPIISRQLQRVITREEVSESFNHRTRQNNLVVFCPLTGTIDKFRQ